MKQRDNMKGDSHPADDIVYLDPDGGVLVHTTCWRPQSGAPNSLKPGEKVVIMSYHPTATEDICPCGSGKRFGSCCRPLPYWRPVCLNPGMQGYHLVQPQTARFTNIAADAVHTFLPNRCGKAPVIHAGGPIWGMIRANESAVPYLGLG